MTPKGKPPPPRPSRPDPDPSIFKRTPEQIAAARARLEAEVAEMKARGVPADLDAGAVQLDRGDTGGDITAAFDHLRELADSWAEERRGLVCWRAIFPVVPEGFLQRPLDTAKVLVGRKACVQAGTRDGCPYKHEHPTCLYERAEAIRERASTYLSLGLGTEAHEEHKLVLQAVDLEAPVALRDTDALNVVRRWLSAMMCKVPMVNAAHVDPLTGDYVSTECVEFAGTEHLLVLGGNPGRGKTVAGVYAIARKGGLYVLDYQLTRPFDIDRAAGTAGVLVVDQLMTADPDKTRRASRALDELVIRRCAAGRKTVLIGNIDWGTFAGRFGVVAAEQGKAKVKHAGNIAERCSQVGVMVVFGGESMRAAP